MLVAFKAAEAQQPLKEGGGQAGLQEAGAFSLIPQPDDFRIDFRQKRIEEFLVGYQSGAVLMSPDPPGHFIIDQMLELPGWRQLLAQFRQLLEGEVVGAEPGEDLFS